MPIDYSSVNDEVIYIIDEWGYKVDIKIEFGADERSIIVMPVLPYRKGGLYELIIGEDVKSISGISLKRPVRMQFTIASQEK